CILRQKKNTTPAPETATKTSRKLSEIFSPPAGGPAPPAAPKQKRPRNTGGCGQYGGGRREFCRKQTARRGRTVRGGAQAQAGPAQGVAACSRAPLAPRAARCRSSARRAAVCICSTRRT